MKKLLMYYQCWLEVTKQQQYWDKWLTDETYFRAIKAQFSSRSRAKLLRQQLMSAMTLVCLPTYPLWRPLTCRHSLGGPGNFEELVKSQSLNGIYAVG